MKTMIRKGRRKTAVAKDKGYSVALVGAGEKKIQVIKEVRTITGLGLQESYDLLKAAIPGRPRVLKRGISQYEARAIRTRMKTVGATTILRNER